MHRNHVLLISHFMIILGAYGKEHVSVKFCVGHRDMFCEERNFCLVCVLLAGWLGGKSI